MYLLLITLNVNNKQNMLNFEHMGFVLINDINLLKSSVKQNPTPLTSTLGTLNFISKLHSNKVK